MAKETSRQMRHSCTFVVKEANEAIEVMRLRQCNETKQVEIMRYMTDEPKDDMSLLSSYGQTYGKDMRSGNLNSHTCTIVK